LSATPNTDPVNYYKLLGVSYSATTREITRAYRNAMKRSHPDKVPVAERAGAEEHAKLLNLAWRTLSKPNDRARYDQTLRQELVQEQIMSHYFGGMGMPGGRDDRFGESLRREQTEYEKKERKQTDRSAILTMLLVFAGATALVVCLIVAVAAVSALVHALL
jgi:DnaJ-class molecular chaperone